MAVPLGLFGALLAASTVAVHLEEVADLPLESAVDLASQLSRSIQRRTGVTPALDDPTWASCKQEDRCVAEIRARTGGDDVVLVQIYGGALKVRLIAERFAPGVGASKRTEIDLPQDAISWPPLLDGAAAALFPEPVKPAANEALTAAGPAVEEPRSRALPWVLIGAAGVAAGTGAIFGALALGARDDIQAGVLLDREYDELRGTMRDRQTAANVSYVVAAVVAAAGVGLLLLSY